MTAIESVAVVLAERVVSTLAQMWLGTDDRGSQQTLPNLLRRRFADVRERRRIQRLLDQVSDAMAERLEQVAAEVDLPDNERAAAIMAAEETLAAAHVTQDDLLAAAMNPALLRQRLTTSQSSSLSSARLSEAGERVYRTALDHACAMLAEGAMLLPSFSQTALTSVLTGLEEQRAALDALLARIPAGTAVPVDDFETSYRKLIDHAFNRVELFGVHLPEHIRSFALTDAYVPLAVHVDGAKLSSDFIVADHRRVLLLGDAGSGKTTLLAWLALNAARRSCAGALKPFNDVLPIFLPLRRLAGQPLPSVAELLDVVAPSVAGLARPGLLHDTFVDGRALVLIDGLDEIAAEHRTVVNDWLSELVTTYPKIRCVVTARPAIAFPDGLRQAGFTQADLLPLDAVSVGTLVRQWFLAINQRPDDYETASQQARDLLTRITEHPPLNSLTSNPLLCTLICATSLDRSVLPSRRSELYEMFVDTLLDRRDTERGITFSNYLGRAEKLAVLQKLAWWLVSNNQTEMDTATAMRLIGDTTSREPDMPGNAEDLYQTLLERSGLLREPAPNRVQFIHQTFQEYLAAKEAADSDDILRLLRHAHDIRWQDVIALTAGHCVPHQANMLINGLVQRSHDDPDHQLLLLNTAERCLHTAYRVNPKVRNEVAESLRHLHSEAAPEDLRREEAVLRVADVLLDVPCVRETSGRRALIHLLPTGKTGAIPDTSNARLQAVSIVRACSRYPGGLGDLLTVIRILDGESAAAQRLEASLHEVTSRLAPREPQSE